MKPRPLRPPPYLALFLGIFAVSTGAILVRLADAPALVIGAVRMTLASLILLPFAWWKARDELRALGRREWLSALAAGFFLALHFATWISSLDYTTVASSVVLVNTNPIWVALLSPYISHDRISRGTALGIGLSMLGTIWIGAGDWSLGTQALIGDGLALLGAMTVTLYLLLGRRLRRQLSLIAYIFVSYTTAALVLLGIVFAMRLPLTGYSSSTYLWLVACAVVPQIIGHSSYNWALGFFSASLIAITLLAEPIFSTILAYLFLGESVTAATLQGGAFVLAGIYLAVRGELKEKTPSEEGLQELAG